MPKALLIDVDLKYRPRKLRGKHVPNFALMQVSTALKTNGYEVGFDIPDPDLVFISAIFSRNNTNAHYEFYKWDSLGIPVDMGGSGISWTKTLPDPFQLYRPDYGLYPSTFSQGFTTRGCIRKCPYCIVNAKEGRFQKAMHVSSFVDLRFKEVMLMDNNILADVDWFFDNTNWIRDHNLRIRDHGMDIRLLTPEIARHLKKLRFVDSQIRFAFDNLSDEKYVRAGIKMLQDAGINTRRNVSFYVMSGFDTTFEQDKYRCDLLRNELGVHAFVMKYHDNDPRLNRLAKWANQRYLYALHTSDEYLASWGL